MICVDKVPFLSTLSLRRATLRVVDGSKSSIISIHALLAESDTGGLYFLGRRKNFYPRSPCGERLRVLDGSKSSIEISIHALLAESDNLRVVDGSKSSIISIHALLAESDCYSLRHSAQSRHFYPRSPCGERH